MVNEVKTRLTAYKDSRDNIVYKFEVYKPIKSTKSRCVFTEIYNVISKTKTE